MNNRISLISIRVAASVVSRGWVGAQGVIGFDAVDVFCGLQADFADALKQSLKRQVNVRVRPHSRQARS
jgi:hypothetical protein